MDTSFEGEFEDEPLPPCDAAEAALLAAPLRIVQIDACIGVSFEADEDEVDAFFMQRWTFAVGVWVRSAHFSENGRRLVSSKAPIVVKLVPRAAFKIRMHTQEGVRFLIFVRRADAAWPLLDTYLAEPRQDAAAHRDLLVQVAAIRARRAARRVELARSRLLD
jgi:hypothetical protein